MKMIEVFARYYDNEKDDYLDRIVALNPSEIAFIEETHNMPMYTKINSRIVIKTGHIISCKNLFSDIMKKLEEEG